MRTLCTHLNINVFEIKKKTINKFVFIYLKNKKVCEFCMRLWKFKLQKGNASFDFLFHYLYYFTTCISKIRYISI